MVNRMVRAEPSPRRQSLLHVQRVAERAGRLLAGALQETGPSHSAALETAHCH